MVQNVILLFLHPPTLDIFPPFPLYIHDSRSHLPLWLDLDLSNSHVIAPAISPPTVLALSRVFYFSSFPFSISTNFATFYFSILRHQFYLSFNVFIIDIFFLIENKNFLIFKDSSFISILKMKITMLKM